jgi:hypothetical protein
MKKELKDAKRNFIVIYSLPKGELHTATVRALYERTVMKTATRIISRDASCKPSEIEFWGSVEEEWIIN